MGRYRCQGTLKYVFQVMTWGDNKDDEPISNPCIFFLIYDHEVGW